MGQKTEEAQSSDKSEEVVSALRACEVGMMLATARYPSMQRHVHLCLVYLMESSWYTTGRDFVCICYLKS
jgi:hypothetical protein